MPVVATESTVRFIRCRTAKLDDIPISDGQLIFAADTKSVYMDSDGSRILVAGLPCVEGTGTAAKTSSPYCHAKWEASMPEVAAPVHGMTILYKVPVAGNGSYGTALQLNSSGYHPVVANVSTMVGTRYAVGCIVPLTYDANQSATLYRDSASSSTVQGCWKVADYNSDTTAGCNTSMYYGKWQVGPDPIYRYQFVVTAPDGRLLPVSNGNNQATTYTKTYQAREFNPFGLIMYYAYTTTIAADSLYNTAGYMYEKNYAAILRYSFNLDITLTEAANNVFPALVAGPVYMVADIQPSGYVKLAACPLSQTLPTTEDGKVYIHLGQTYYGTSTDSKHRIQMRADKPVYWFKNGRLCLYTMQNLSATAYTGVATRAVNDANGNDISETYATNEALDELKKSPPYGVVIPTGTVTQECQRVELRAGGLTPVGAFTAMPCHVSRSCVIDNCSARHVNYYLDRYDSSKKEDGTASVLTGADGDVFVEFPVIAYTLTGTVNSGIYQGRKFLLMSDRPFSFQGVAAPVDRAFLVGATDNQPRTQYISKYPSCLCSSQGVPVTTTDSTKPPKYVANQNQMLRSLSGALVGAGMHQAKLETCARRNGCHVSNWAMEAYLIKLALVATATKDGQATSMGAGLAHTANSSTYATCRQTGRANFLGDMGGAIAASVSLYVHSETLDQRMEGTYYVSGTNEWSNGTATLKQVSGTTQWQFVLNSDGTVLLTSSAPANATNPWDDIWNGLITFESPQDGDIPWNNAATADPILQMVATSFMGVENLWGTLPTTQCGIYKDSDTTFRYTLDPSEYPTTDAELAAAVNGTTPLYVNSVDFPWVTGAVMHATDVDLEWMLPTAAESGSVTGYGTDMVYSATGCGKELWRGGNLQQGTYCGPFFMRAYYSINSDGTIIGNYHKTYLMI